MEAAQTITRPEGAAREGGAAYKQPRKLKAPGLRGKKRFHTA
ncbi:MAG TPA: hypothetical protein VF026_32420 [Ktedonobacteraceae bacterium]